MFILNCSICGIELGQASQSTRITCPSCVEFREYVRRYMAGDNYYDNNGFTGVTWNDACDKETRINNSIILALSGAEDYELEPST